MYNNPSKTPVVAEEGETMDDQEHGIAGTVVDKDILVVNAPPLRLPILFRESTTLYPPVPRARHWRVFRRLTYTVHVSVNIPTLPVCSGRDCVMKNWVYRVSVLAFW